MQDGSTTNGGDSVARQTTLGQSQNIHVRSLHSVNDRAQLGTLITQRTKRTNIPATNSGSRFGVEKSMRGRKFSRFLLKKETYLSRFWKLRSFVHSQTHKVQDGALLSLYCVVLLARPWPSTQASP